MPRYRETFTIFPRRLKSGRVVWYYRTYTPNGERTTAHSTGKTNRTQARNYCMELLASGMLYTETGMTFGAYAGKFYDDKSQWVQDKVQAASGKERPFSRKTIELYRLYLRTKILPFFARLKLADIKPHHVKKFRTELIEANISNSAINITCFCLKTIFSYAIADRYITANPCDSLRRLSINARTRDSFSEDELTAIFGAEWDGDIRRRLFSVTAAVTGMRMSEIMAIRSETLHDDYIEVDRQYDGLTKSLAPLKTGEARKVRCPARLISMLRPLAADNGFVFTETAYTYTKTFCKHIDKEQQKARGLCFHSLRHFFNTYMLANNIPEIKVKSIIGHSSGKGSMTERYANFRPEHFDDVAELQSVLLEQFLRRHEDITPHSDS